jgi:hypothetical protein
MHGMSLAPQCSFSLARFVGHQEAREALVLAVVGVMVVMLGWNVIMLILRLY